MRSNIPAERPLMGTVRCLAVERWKSRCDGVPDPGQVLCPIHIEKRDRGEEDYDIAIVPLSEFTIPEPVPDEIPERKLLLAAYDALRSYQYGNSSTELAEEIANAIGLYFSGGKK
jgi:hypothetical protein